MLLLSTFIFLEYFYLFIHFSVSLLLGLVVLIFSYLLITQQPDSAKLSSYECGFDPFGDARSPFNIHFYLVGILFIVFDLELTYLFPWAISLKFLGIFGYGVMFFFFICFNGWVYIRMGERCVELGVTFYLFILLF